MVEKLTRLKADTEYLAPQYRDNTDNDMAMIVYLPDAPIIEGELNYIQQLQAMQLRRVVKTVIGRSTLLNPIVPSTTGIGDEMRLHTQNGIFYASIDGIVKTVTAYDNPVTGTKSEGGNRVQLPTWGAEGRQDLVYLEIWFEEIMAVGGIGSANTTVTRFGMDHSFIETNNLKVATYGDLQETARRVQLRGKIRVAPNTRSVVGLLARNSAIHAYADRGGFFAAGNGDITSATNLNTVDGFAFAIPLVVATRGANASAMTFEVIAPNTATLQQLASAALKDVAQYATDIGDLKAASGQQATQILSLREENTTLKTQLAGAQSQLVTARSQLQTLERMVSAERNRHIHRAEAGNLQTFMGGNTITNGTHIWGISMAELPPNTRFSIDKVFAILPPGTSFRLDVLAVNSRLSRVWTWTPQLNNGGTYSYNGEYLQRSRTTQIIELPEYDSTVYQNLLIRTYLIVGATITLRPTYNHAFGQVEFSMVPK